MFRVARLKDTEDLVSSSVSAIPFYNAEMEVSMVCNRELEKTDKQLILDPTATTH